MINSLYKGILSFFDNSKFRFIAIKTAITEDIAIFSKRKLYRSVKWSNAQRAEFNTYWKEIYGKKIKDKWHRLYEASSGKFSIDYVPEKMFSTKIEPLLNDRRYAICMDDKSMVEILSKNCGCVVPKTIIGCIGGRYFDSERKPIKFETAIEILKTSNDVVSKPTSGSSSGNGLTFFDSFSSKSNEEIAKLIKSFGRDFIVQEKIEQHESLAALNNSSINTIRITTYIIDGEIYHFPLVLRIGRSGKKVDNIHAGGLCIGMNESGELLDKAFLLGYGDNSKKYTTHPDSKIAFSGYKLPGINNVINAACKVHQNMPHTNIVSWDFSIDRDNNPVLIEANIMGQSIWICQMIYGKGAFGKNTKKIVGMLKNGK